MTRHVNSLFRRFERDERGAVAVLVAVSIVAMLGFGALVVDLANVLMAQSIVQASANAAALAGSQEIGNGGAPITTATTYSSLTGDKNALGDLTDHVGDRVSEVDLCDDLGGQLGGRLQHELHQRPTCIAPPCSPAVNLITVEETANVPIYFGRLFGISTIPVKAAATASAQGYALGPYNVAVVLDTTKSMGSAPSGGTSTTACSGYSTAIDCAVAGAQTMLSELWPCASGLTSCTGATPVDEVALFVFPPVTNPTSAGEEIGCTKPAIATYYAGVEFAASAASTTATLSVATMNSSTAFNTGSMALVTDAGTRRPPAKTSSGSAVLTFPSGVLTTNVTTGLPIQDTTTPGAIPAGTTVKTTPTPGASTVTMSATATGGGVKSGDLITFGPSVPPGSGGYAWPWWNNTGSTTMSTVTVPTTAVMSTSPNGRSDRHHTFSKATT